MIVENDINTNSKLEKVKKTKDKKKNNNEEDKDLNIYMLGSSKKLEEIRIEDYQEIESRKLICVKGSDIYETSRDQESQYYKQNDIELKPINILEKHKIDSNIRRRLVDWLFEVFSSYKCDDQTVFLTITYMDVYLYKCKTTLHNENIHLIGLVCLFIASKMEDMYPIDIKSLVSRIGHDKYSHNEIKKKEIEILNTLSYRLGDSTVLEFIKNFIYDLKFNNRSELKKFKLFEKVQNLEKESIYIAKLCLHFDFLSSYKNSLKAIACMIAAYDIIRSSEEPEKTNNQIDFLQNWITFLVLNSRYDDKNIYKLYEIIKSCYDQYNNIKDIERNLNKLS